MPATTSQEIPAVREAPSYTNRVVILESGTALRPDGTIDPALFAEVMSWCDFTGRHDSRRPALVVLDLTTDLTKIIQDLITTTAQWQRTHNQNGPDVSLTYRFNPGLTRFEDNLRERNWPVGGQEGRRAYICYFGLTYQQLIRVPDLALLNMLAFAVPDLRANTAKWSEAAGLTGHLGQSYLVSQPVGGSGGVNEVVVLDGSLTARAFRIKQA